MTFSSDIGSISAWSHLLYHSSCFVYLMVLVARMAMSVFLVVNGAVCVHEDAF